MPDEALVNRNSITAPKDYDVPGAQEFVLRAVIASFDGSASASAWQPALQLLSPAGDVMWTAVNPSVAAAGSADASWFPGGGLGIPSGQLLPVCNVHQTNTFTWTPSITTPRSISWPKFVTSDPATFKLNAGSGNVRVLRPGTYAAFVTVTPNTSWPDVTAGGPVRIGSWGGDQNEPSGVAPYGQYPDIDLFAPLAHGDTVNVPAFSVLLFQNPGDLQIGGMNFSGVNFVGSGALATVWRIGDYVEA